MSRFTIQETDEHLTLWDTEGLELESSIVSLTAEDSDLLQVDLTSQGYEYNLEETKALIEFLQGVVAEAEGK